MSLLQKNEQLTRKVEMLEAELSYYRNLASMIPSDSSSALNADNRIQSISYDESVQDYILHVSLSTIERFFERVCDGLNEHVVSINKDGIITMCNQQTAVDLLVNREEARGMHIQELLKVPAHQIKLLQTLNSGIPIFSEEVWDKNYGIIHTHLLRDASGEIIRVIGVFNRLNEAWEGEKLSLLGQISAGIAHEIRNPLTVVKGFLQHYIPTVDEHIAKTITDVLIPEINRANKIITDFLTVSKPSTMSYERLNINETIADFHKLVFSESLMNGIELEVSTDHALENVFTDFDKSKLLQVLLNLFGNSVDAKRDQPLKISITTLLEDARTVLISIKDTGSGINTEDLDKIFNPFFTTKEAGTGLGLSVSKKIIEAHGGTIRVESSIGHGTMFKIRLPIHTL